MKNIIRQLDENSLENNKPEEIVATPISVAPPKNVLQKQPVKDSKGAKIARFAAGSIFGIIFLVFCFAMLSAALRGPDQITVNGVNGKAGLVDPNYKPIRLVSGNTSPDFILNQVGGDPIQLSKLRGKTILLNFWASWCQPCIDEMPALQQFYLQHRNDNITVLAVDYREDVATIKNFFKDHNLTLPVAMDTIGDVTGKGYDISQFPESYFVDKNGVIQAYSYGGLTLDQMNADLQKVWKVSGK